MGKLYWKPGNMLYPLPVVMVSCSYEGKDNIITVAWAGTICSDPAMLSISVRKERHSYHMIDNTNEFVVNLVTEDLTFATDYCGVASGRDVDKFKEMKLTKIESKYVGAPSISESPVNIECEVSHTMELGTHTIFMAKVLGVTVDDKYMDENNKFNLNDSELVTYSHGEYYTLGEKIGTFGYSVRKKN
jgi:flavin reductase (DIM6/NTAB) family NADH-FMN oxidoreductase RutF